MSTKEANKEEKSQGPEAAVNQVENADNQENTQDNQSQEAAEAAAPEAEQKNLSEELQKLKDQHLRLFADFENYKRRTAKERIDLFGSANQELMSALLPVLDDFQRALKNLEETEAHSGVQLIFGKLENTLKQKGLKPMESSVGKNFDLDTMEAVTRIPAPEEALKGKVVDELERGYELGTKIIRYAKVVVGE